MDGNDVGGLGKSGIEASGVEVQAEGDEQGGCEDGVTGRMIGELADEEVDAGRPRIDSKTDGGFRTISEQDNMKNRGGTRRIGPGESMPI